MQSKFEKIMKWISKNHEHHYNSENFSIDLETGNKKYNDGKKCKCIDGNQAYVNSLKLEKFIKKLYKNEAKN